LTGAMILAACDAEVTSVGTWIEDAQVKVDASSEIGDAEPPLDSGIGGELDAAISGDGEIDAVVGAGIYLEAESGELTGFTIGNDPTASGGQFIAPPTSGGSDTQPGPARARYSIELPQAGRYVFWGRIHSPDALHNRFWVQVDGSTWYLWRITTGEIWYWNRVHDNVNYYMPIVYDLSAGTHELLVANAIDGVQLDRWYVTSAGDAPPQTDTPCAPPNSVPLGGTCVPSCGSLGGMTCGTPQCAGRMLVPMQVYDCPVCCF
jgi:hypothetical protein